MIIQKLPTTPRIMLTGANGQLGWELARCLMPLGEVMALTRAQCDLSNPESLSGIVQEIKPDIIVNAAAYTAVDKAEEEEALATAINGTAVGVLAEEAKKHKALFIHYSTDYVFDGTKPTPYTEEDIPNPINAYGRGKLAGEEAVLQVGCKHLIFRTSWVYSSRGNNFLKTIKRLVLERDEIGIVSDQIGAPTWARLIAETTSHSVRQSLRENRQGTFASDVYHLTSTGETSWYGLAKKIVEFSCLQMKEKKKKCDIRPIESNDYPTPAQRPKNSRLVVDKLEQNYELKMPGWDYALRLCVDE